MSENTNELNTAAPPTGEVVSQISEAINTNNDTTSEGMEQTQVPKDDNPSVIEATVLTASQDNTMVSALTSYLDVQRSDAVDIPFKGAPVADPAFVFPKGYFDVAQRSIRLVTLKLKSKDPSGLPLARIDIANALLSRSFISTKFTYPMYVRYNLEVQVRMLATNFHYGQVMVVWRPAFAPLLSYQWDLQNDKIACNISPTNSQPTAYDWVWTASQLPHKVMPITAGSTVVMSCPWTLNRQYAPTANLLELPYHPGYLDIYMLTPSLPADIDPPALQIFGRFKDCVGFGYRSVAEPCNSFKRPKLIEYKRLSDDPDFTFISGVDPLYWDAHCANDTGYHLSGFKNAHADGSAGTRWEFVYRSDTSTYSPSTTWSFAESKAPLPPSGETTKEKEVLQGYEVPQVEGGNLTRTWRNVASKVNTIATFIGDGLAWLGLSKPPLGKNPERYVHVTPPYSSSVCTDITVSTGYNPISQVQNAKDDHPNVTMIADMGKIFTYLAYFQLSRTKAYTLYLSPECGVTSRNIHGALQAMSPAAYIASRFRYWRGDLLYRIHFSSSSFVATRARIYVKYLKEDTDDVFGLVPTQIVEIKGDTIVEGRVPFLNDKYWARYGEFNKFYCLQIQLLDTAVTWDNANEAPIYCTIWYAYDGFQVACPQSFKAYGVFNGIGRGLTNRGIVGPFRAHVGSGESNAMKDSKPKETLPGNGAQLEEEKEQVQGRDLPGETPMTLTSTSGMNDIPTSIYHIAKRYQPSKTSLLCPFLPFTFCTTTFYQSGNHERQGAICSYYPMTAMFNPLFRWMRGSVCVLSNSVEHMFDYYSMDEAPGLYAAKGVLKGESQTFYLMSERPYLNANGETLCAYRSPYRSDMNFVSTPIVASYFPARSLIGQENTMVPISSLLKEDKLLISMEMKPAQTEHEVYWSYGDDLCYSQWMGVPVQIGLKNPILANFLYSPSRTGEPMAVSGATRGSQSAVYASDTQN